MKLTFQNTYRLVFQFLILFGFIANIKLGPITTRRVILLIAVLYLIPNWTKVRNLIRIIKPSIKISLLLLFGCFFIALMHSGGASSSEFNKYFTTRDVTTLFLNVTIMAFWCAIEIKSFEKFTKLMVAVILLQSIFTFISAVYSPFRIFVAENFMSESYQERSQNIIYGMGGRAAGLGIAWSMGSLVLAYGCLMLIALKLREKISMLWFSVCYAVILGATALMGRTGLLAEFVFLIFYGIMGGKIKNMFALVLVAIGSALVIRQILSMYDAYVAETTEAWMLQIMDEDKVASINEGVVRGGFPEFNNDFIFGTGLELGRYGVYTFSADSGYIRTYTSIGVVGMVCYYGGMFLLLVSTLLKRVSSDMKKLFWVGLAVLFTIEYKEPYIGMNVFPWILFTTGLMLSMESKYIRKNEDINSGRLLPQTPSCSKV